MWFAWGPTQVADTPPPTRPPNNEKSAIFYKTTWCWPKSLVAAINYVIFVSDLRSCTIIFHDELLPLACHTFNFHRCVLLCAMSEHTHLQLRWQWLLVADEEWVQIAHGKQSVIPVSDQPLLVVRKNRGLRGRDRGGRGRYGVGDLCSMGQTGGGDPWTTHCTLSFELFRSKKFRGSLICFACYSRYQFFFSRSLHGLLVHCWLHVTPHHITSAPPSLFSFNKSHGSLLHCWLHVAEQKSLVIGNGTFPCAP